MLVLLQNCIGFNKYWQEALELNLCEFWELLMMSWTVNNLPVLANVPFSAVQRVMGLYIPEASLCGGDLHRMEMEQPAKAGHSRIGPFEPLWADLYFLRWTCWPPYKHTRTPSLHKACSACRPFPFRHPTSWLPMCLCAPPCAAATNTLRSVQNVVVFGFVSNMQVMF